MDEFKMQMNWNQEELEQWSVAAQQKDEDFLAIEKYKRADELKIKELTLQLEHLQKNFLIHEAKLHGEATETQALFGTCGMNAARRRRPPAWRKSLK